jgi:Domain of unknown function (DUF5666)
MSIRTITGVCMGAVLAVSAVAQGAGVRIRGTVEQVEGPVVTVVTAMGEKLPITLAADARIMAIVKSSLSNVQPGSFVGATALPQRDGTWKAVEVHIFPESLRGTGEGDRPYDYKPKSTMTNGTVKALTKSSLNGTVEKSDSSAISIVYKDGEKRIAITPETVIVAYEPGQRDELKPGAMVYISSAAKQPDGSLVANRVNVGRGIAPPM